MRTLTIALAAVCAAAFAATVPQSSIDDYYFSRPNCTNVTGTVIGEPPAYSTLRREDIAWLREAAAERAALQSRSWSGLSTSIVQEVTKIGSFPLSSSNTFSHFTSAKEWVNGTLETNIVVGWNYVTNMGSGIDKVRSASIDIAGGLSFGSGFSGYLSTNGADWLQSSQSIGGTNISWSLPPYTNIITTVSTSYPSYYIDDNWNYVDNTTQHVEIITMPMTNGTVSAWTNSWSVPLPFVQTKTTTNVIWRDRYDLLFTDMRLKTYDREKPEAFSGIPRYSTVTNWYGWLGGMSRLASEAIVTNGIECYYATWYGDEWETAPTNSTQTLRFYIEGGHAAVGGGWGHGFWPASGAHNLQLRTNFKWPLVTTGGVNRIKSATLYVVIDGHSDVFKNDRWNYDIGYFAKKIGSATQAGTPDPYGYVDFSVSVNLMSLYREAASALAFGYFPSMDGKDYCAEFSLVMTFYLVFDMAPWASLPDW